MTLTPAPTPPTRPRLTAGHVALIKRTLLGAWLAGGAAFALVQLVRALRMRRRLRAAPVPVSATLIREVEDVAARLGVRPVPVRAMTDIGSPMIWSLGPPTLIWPAELPPAELAPCSLRGLIAHELAHVKRRDHWSGWLELAAGCAWWWNPVYWLVRRRLRENAELACDAHAVAALPARAGRRAYAEGLLAVCEAMSTRRAAPVLAMGASTGAGGRRFLERRLTMILAERTSSLSLRGASRAALLLLVVLALAGVPAWSQQVDPQPGATSATILLDRTAEVNGWAVSLDSGAPQLLATVRDATDSLPADARQLIDAREDEEAKARKELEERLAKGRNELNDRLQALQDDHAKSGRLDEAVAIRDYLRARGTPTATKSYRLVSKLLGENLKVYPRWKAAITDCESLMSFRGQADRQVKCEVVGSTDGTVWGTDVYTDDSDVATAAVHAGLVKPGERRTVTVTILPGQQGYLGTTRNDVESRSYLTWGGSFRFEGVEAADAALRTTRLRGKLDVIRNYGRIAKVRSTMPKEQAVVIKEPLRETTRLELPTESRKFGQTVIREITGDTEAGAVWGSGVYTGDSAVPAAAVHAGVLKEGERAKVKITVLPGRDSYDGTERYGVTSQSYGSWPDSIMIERAADDAEVTAEPEPQGLQLRLELPQSGRVVY